MGNLLSYSGISTKLRAMQKKLVSEEEFQEIVRMEHISQVVSYLKKKPAYQSRWSDLDENRIPVDEIEKRLRQSVFQDFSKLYQFANKDQRKFLSLYSKRYEIRVLKEIMANLFDNRETSNVDVSPYGDFFRKHSSLDLPKLLQCRNMKEFLTAIKGSEYESALTQVQEGALLFDYGMALDLYYFSYIWNVRKKIFSGTDLQEITKAYGEKFDLLNLQFIHRSVYFYQMKPDAVYPLLIPVNYILKPDHIRALTEAENENEFQSVLQKTYYGKRSGQLTPANLEEFYNQTLRGILEEEARKNPYSVAILYSYLYHKEHEVSRLIVALECVRYHQDPQRAMEFIMRN